MTQRVACKQVNARDWSAGVLGKAIEAAGNKGNEQVCFFSNENRQVERQTDRQTNKQTDRPEKASSVKVRCEANHKSGTDKHLVESLICIMQNEDFNKISHQLV